MGPPVCDGPALRVGGLVPHHAHPQAWACITVDAPHRQQGLSWNSAGTLAEGVGGPSLSRGARPDHAALQGRVLRSRAPPQQGLACSCRWWPSPTMAATLGPALGIGLVTLLSISRSPAGWHGPVPSGGVPGAAPGRAWGRAPPR